MTKYLRKICLVIALLIPGITCVAATLEELLAEYPLRPGSRWVYRHVRYDGVGGLDQNVITKSWLTEISFVEQRDIAQGTLFVLATKGSDSSIEITGTASEGHIQ